MGGHDGGKHFRRGGWKFPLMWTILRWIIGTTWAALDGVPPAPGATAGEPVGLLLAITKAS